MPQKTTQKVLGRQVRRYYQLLLRLGYEQVFRSMMETPDAPLPTGPTKPGALEAEPAAAEPRTIQLDFGRIFLACAGADEPADGLTALDALAQAVLDLSDEDAAAGEWDAAEVEEGYGPFSQACGGLMARLMRPVFGLG